MFYYITPDEFEEAHKRILAAPNFEEVDIAAGNKAYSNGMVLYARFLQELGEPSLQRHLMMELVRHYP